MSDSNGGQYFDLRIWAAGNIQDANEFLPSYRVYDPIQEAATEFGCEVSLVERTSDFSVYEVTHGTDGVVGHYKATSAKDSYDDRVLGSVVKVEPKQVTKTEWV